MKDNLVNKYVIFYIKRNLFGAFFCAMIAFIPLFITSLIYNVEPNDTLISFFPFLIAFIILLISFLFILRFKWMIKKQESEFLTQFNDEHVKQLEHLIFLSDQWLICAGSSAYFKDNIAILTHKEMKGQPKIFITTRDGTKYSFWCLSFESLDAINEWCHPRRG